MMNSDIFMGALYLIAGLIIVCMGLCLALYQPHFRANKGEGIDKHCSHKWGDNAIMIISGPGHGQVRRILIDREWKIEPESSSRAIVFKDESL